jgi:hypothetical protein
MCALEGVEVNLLLVSLTHHKWQTQVYPMKLTMDYLEEVMEDVPDHKDLFSSLLCTSGMKAYPNLNQTYKLLDLLPDELFHLDVVQLVVVAQLLGDGGFTHGWRSSEEDSNWLEKGPKIIITLKLGE